MEWIWISTLFYAYRQKNKSNALEPHFAHPFLIPKTHHIRWE